MNTNNRTASMRIWTITAMITLAGVGCKNAASDALQLVPSAGKQEVAVPIGATQAEFKDWKKLVGNYSLTQFNGQAVTTHYTEVKENMSSFRKISG